MAVCPGFAEDTVHLHHSLKALQKGILAFALTYRNLQRHYLTIFSGQAQICGPCLPVD